jgi:hypothetical protein
MHFSNIVEKSNNNLDEETEERVIMNQETIASSSVSQTEPSCVQFSAQIEETYATYFPRGRPSC